jgi:hypothetical protein
MLNCSNVALQIVCAPFGVSMAVGLLRTLGDPHINTCQAGDIQDSTSKPSVRRMNIAMV